MMQQNGSSFNIYLKRILPDLLPWIVEERSLNASRVVQHIRTAIKMSKKKKAGADLAAVFRFGSSPIFSKLLLSISTHPEHVMKSLQMAVECVYKALQSKLLGILCDFETELLSNSTLLHSKKKVLLSLTEIFTFEELEDIASLCQKYNVICISDEVYEWITSDKNKKHIRIATLPNIWQKTLTNGSWTIGSEHLIRSC
ncbi:unnamed protein product [Rotaria sordida]|uniref:Uncharacterized protein n=1 Tax=Rotaria sordida TaxID=392033 RepID=A0A816BXE7_9BILA|nr:unnamed protein product [Rotaria sordida]CAF1615248.1 unnamed protein product [Rotaria sordida]